MDLGDEMSLEIARQVRRWPTGTAPHTQLERSFEGAEFHSKPCECRERVHDQPTPIAGIPIAPVRIRSILDRTVDTDRLGAGRASGSTGEAARWQNSPLTVLADLYASSYM